jgi:hypothetical protein
MVVVVHGVVTHLNLSFLGMCLGHTKSPQKHHFEAHGLLPPHYQGVTVKNGLKYTK